MLVRVEGVCFGFAGQTLLREISFSLHRGDRVGLVGLNGCGKTTLLRIMAGSLRPHRGRVVAARGVRVSYVGFLGEPPPELRLHDFLTVPVGELAAMERQLQRLAQELATAPVGRQASEGPGRAGPGVGG